MTDAPPAFPAYYLRYGTAYVAWFCEPEGARRWLDAGEEILNVWDGSYLSAVGFEPEPGAEYEDLGHEHCMAEDCPEGGDDD